MFKGITVWKGEVEIFDLTGHPTAKRAYAWSHREGPNDEDERIVAILEIPPVESAVTAVRIQIVKDAKEQMQKGARELKKEMDEKFSKPHPPSN